MPPVHPTPTEPSAFGCYGMSLRDYFAAQALPAAIAHNKEALESDGVAFYLGGDVEIIPAGIAEDCYNIADAMMRERERQK